MDKIKEICEKSNVKLTIKDTRENGIRTDYDYLDNMKVLEKMYNRRLKGYVISGYEIIE